MGTCDIGRGKVNKNHCHSPFYLGQYCRNSNDNFVVAVSPVPFWRFKTGQGPNSHE